MRKRNEMHDALFVTVAIFILWLTLCAVGYAQDLPPGCDVPPKPTAIVYTRQPRAVAPVNDKISDAANWQHVSDSQLVFSFGESDVIYDARPARVSKVYDCTTSPEICAAQEAKVSPDGQRIIFSVSRGTSLYPVNIWGSSIMSEVREFNTTSAELWLYDVAKDKRTRLTAGFVDRAPDWQSNDRIVFTSNRQMEYAPLGESNNNFYPFTNQQVYTARISNGGLADIKNISPEESFALNPTVLTNGQICWSSWQGFGDRGIGHTPQNQWWIKCTEGNGTGGWVWLGAHGSPYIRTDRQPWYDPARSGSDVTQYMTLRPVSEIHPGYLAVTSYYRGNGHALGIPFGAQALPPFVEGVSKYSNYLYRYYEDSRPGSGRYIPSTLQALTPFGTAGDDSFPRFTKQGKALGRAGFPAAWPGDGPEWLLTIARGWCYEAALDMGYATIASMGNEPTCQKYIALAKVPIVTNPFDPAQVQPLACTATRWQCWDAHSVSTYQQRFGQPQPAQPVPITGDHGTLQVVNARAGELFQIPGANYPAQDKITFQGNADADAMQTIAALRIELIEPWDKLPTKAGFKARMLLSDTPLLADGSLKVDVPCEQPFLMSGVGKTGKVVAVDNMAHSLRCGEVRTCHGCHDGHSEERNKAIGMSAAERFKATQAAQ